ncbi:MAG TPA: HAD-IA family hydrolase [Conexibacter sp.]|nr:HAD-IA family hydrolase [Conexibacter sp.]
MSTGTLIFDCDGVLADTERHGHLPAFNQTFREVGVPVQWSEDEYAEKLLIGGGKERMATLLDDPRVLQAVDVPADEAGRRALLATWHRRKTELYRRIVEEGRLPPRPGVKRLSDEAAAAGWRLAVASTSAEESVRAVLEHAVGAERAADFAVLAGDVVARKKPDPEIYALAVRQTASDPRRTIVVEDSRIGMLAAAAAGLACIVTVSGYTAGERHDRACLVVSDLGEPGRPMRVLADPAGVEPADVVTLDVLRSCLTPAANQRGAT